MNDYKIFYSPHYYADIGENHVFPIKKFELVRDKLLAEKTLLEEEIVEPQPAEIADVLLVHTEDYISRLRSGNLTAKEIRKLGLPWSNALVRRSFLATSGTINAAKRVRCGRFFKSRRRHASCFSRPRRRFLRIKRCRRCCSSFAEEKLSQKVFNR